MGKAAAIHEVGNGGDLSGDGGEPGFWGGIEPRDAGQQASGVGVAWVGEEFAHGGAFDDPSGIHHCHFVTGFGNDSKVVGDENHAHAHFFLEVADQSQNLRLHRDIEGGGRFVGDEQFGFIDERHGDHDALAHAAGELVRVFIHPCFRSGDADARQHFHAAPTHFRGGDGVMQGHRFGQLAADGLDRIERGHGLLENHADLATAQAAE